MNRRPRPSHHCTILPPHIADSVAKNGNEDERRAAIDSLAIDRGLMAMRLQAPLAPRPSAGPVAAGLQRSIHDAEHDETLPGLPVRSEGEPPLNDLAADEAYDGLGATYVFYDDAYDRDSIDDEALPLIATVHFGERYDNAFWNGMQMVFGDGDGQLFNRFTVSLDVIGHELTHGVVQDEAGLIYLNQSGALNESLADVFGSLVKQHSLGQSAADADWLIGAGLFTDQVQGVALRSMKEPGTAYDDPILGKDPQPAKMSDFVHTTRDNGGVHINSGIPNRAFYLAATELGGHAWERAGRIWYDTMRNPQVRATTGFRRFARICVETAGQLFGAGSTEQKAVHESWREVEVLR
jgi:Zn-dependent metalloprotease